MKPLSILVAILLCMATAADAQDSAVRSDLNAEEAKLGIDATAFGRRYENSIGRRLANTIVFIFNYKKLLDNLPVGAYPMQDVLSDCDRLKGERINLGTKTAFVRATRDAPPSQSDKFMGLRYKPDGNDMATLRGLCDADRTPLRLFDLMAKEGKWERVKKTQLSSNAIKFTQGRIEISDFRRVFSSNAVIWNVQSAESHLANNNWQLEWELSEIDQVEVANDNSVWWKYEYSDDQQSEGLGDFYLSYSLQPNESLLPGSVSPHGSASISTCGIDEYNEINCQMKWDSPPATVDDQEGTFSLWYESVSEAGEDRQLENWESWYVLTEEPFPSGKADLWIEHDALR